MYIELHKQLRRVTMPLLFPLAVLITWEIAVDTNIMSSYAFSKPSNIFLTACIMTTSLNFWHDIFISLGRLAAGIAIGTSLGLLLGYWLYLSRMSGRLLGPTFDFVSQFPPVVWAPLLIAIFGIGELSKIALIALATSLVMYVAVRQGLRSISGRLLEAVSVYRRPLSTRIFNIYWPGSLPYFFDGLKTAIVYGWIVLLLAEMIGSEDGLGWLLWDSRTFGRAPEMMVTLFTIGIIGKALLSFINYASRKASPWYGQYKSEPAWGWNGRATYNRPGHVQDKGRAITAVRLQP